MAEHRNHIIVPVDGEQEFHLDPVPQNLLQDLDGWLESNGLRSADDYPYDRETAATQEERLRVTEEDRYVQSIHNIAFRDAMEKEAYERNERKSFISRLRNSTIDIHTADNDCIRNVPLDRMAQICDTVYIMAKNQSWNTDPCSGRPMAALSGVHISLKSYPKSSVQEFVNVVLFYDHSDSTTPRNDDDDVSASVASAVDRISNDALIDCCRIAHYLMAELIVNAITNIFIHSIDTKNCFVICQLADELSLSSTLFERALVHMMDTIGDPDSNNEAGWDDNDMLNSELKERIILMQRAIESSIHTQNRNRRLYFASIEEYLSIFAERVQYYQERLAEAKECQVSHTKIGSRGWLDAQEKIEQQEQRVRTLEMALAEQKVLFRHSKFRRRE